MNAVNPLLTNKEPIQATASNNNATTPDGTFSQLLSAEIDGRGAPSSTGDSKTISAAPQLPASGKPNSSSQDDKANPKAEDEPASTVNNASSLTPAMLTMAVAHAGQMVLKPVDPAMDTRGAPPDSKDEGSPGTASPTLCSSTPGIPVFPDNESVPGKPIFLDDELGSSEGEVLPLTSGILTLAYASRRILKPGDPAMNEHATNRVDAADTRVNPSRDFASVNTLADSVAKLAEHDFRPPNVPGLVKQAMPESGAILDAATLSPQVQPPVVSNHMKETDSPASLEAIIKTRGEPAQANPGRDASLTGTQVNPSRDFASVNTLADSVAKLAEHDFQPPNAPGLAKQAMPKSGVILDAAMLSPQIQPSGVSNYLKETDSLQPRVGSPDWNQALGQKVVWMVEGAQQTATLTLNPPDLGPMRIVLNLTDNQVGATFISAQPEVRAAIEAAMPRLREMMDNAGMQLSGSSVGSGAPNSNTGSGEQRGQDWRGRPVAREIEPVAWVMATNVGHSGKGIIDTHV